MYTEILEREMFFFVSEESEWIIHHQSIFRVKNKWMMYYNTHYIAVAPGCKENEVKDDWKMFEIPTLLVYAYTMAVYVLYILNIF